MLKINKNYLNLNQSYLFSTIAKKINEFTKNNPDKKIIRMGIGDVTRPLAPVVIDALKKGVDDMSKAETFKGYGPEQGYDFTRNAVKGYYENFGVNLELDEIFISDGAKSDVGNVLDIFDVDNKVLIPDPVYPVYVDTNIMAGRNIEYINATEENGFLPLPDSSMSADIIYICSPNNPTGAAYSKEQLKVWVDFAIDQNAVILFDAAYEAFISDDSLAKSIYQIEGAKKCAIEFCSLSKTAGFTGTRCGYTVVPTELEFDNVSLNKLWVRRQTTKFNGVPYITQCGAAAVFTEQGQEQIKQTINYYKANAEVMTKAMDEMGFWYTGGKNSPYVWLKCPNNMKSWDFFDLLLNEVYVVGTPGAGFGQNGEGFFRLTAFGNNENTVEAMNRLKSLKF
ncbi:MAG: LL-diaminopimelate aminotransferase [Acutalibacteraceae bacterium]|nr:LL-diaminopimelate aminotransferase [Acutalibacteraceae bacterium]